MPPRPEIFPTDRLSVPATVGLVGPAPRATPVRTRTSGSRARLRRPAVPACEPCWRSDDSDPDTRVARPLRAHPDRDGADLASQRAAVQRHRLTQRPARRSARQATAGQGDHAPAVLLHLRSRDRARRADLRRPGVLVPRPRRHHHRRPDDDLPEGHPRHRGTPRRAGRALRVRHRGADRHRGGRLDRCGGHRPARSHDRPRLGRRSGHGRGQGRAADDRRHGFWSRGTQARGSRCDGSEL